MVDTISQKWISILQEEDPITKLETYLEGI